MKKSTLLYAFLLSCAASTTNAQESLVWTNSGGTGEWSIIASEWGLDPGIGVLLPSGWLNKYTAVFDGRGLFVDQDGNPLTKESIKLSGEMEVADIIVSGDKDYSITYKDDKSTDKIIGDGTLTKSGSGNFTLNVLNELKGGTIVKGGAVIMDKTDSPNVFGDKVVLENGAISLAPTTISGTFKVTVPITIAEGTSGSIIAGRYAQICGPITGSNDLTIYSGGERVYFTSDKAGKEDMTMFDNFTGNLIIDVSNQTASGNPGYTGVQFTTTKTFDGVSEMTNIDQTFANTKITLKANAGLTSASGVRCYAIGELQAEEGGFLYGYGSGGSTTPVIWWSIGHSNTDVLDLPLWLRDGRKDNKNKFGVIKEGTGTYIMTGTKNAATGTLFQGMHVKNGKLYINTSATDDAITALCRSTKALTIYQGAVGGGNGRITGEVTVDGGTLEVGCNGAYGQLILDDTTDGTTKSPLTVKNGGSVVMKIASASQYDQLTTNHAATFNGSKIVVKVDPNCAINEGDEFTILTSAVKTAGDTYEVEFDGTSPVALSYEEQSFESGTTTDAEGTVTPVNGYKLVVKAGSTTGIVNASLENAINVFAFDGKVFVDGSDIVSVEVLNMQGQIVASSTESTLSLNVVKGIYLVKVKTLSGSVTKKVVL